MLVDRLVWRRGTIMYVGRQVSLENGNNYVCGNYLMFFFCVACVYVYCLFLVLFFLCLLLVEFSRGGGRRGGGEICRVV